MADIEKKIEMMWDKEASSGGIYATPRFGLTADLVGRFAAGHPEAIPEVSLYPSSVLADVSGKKVLCLASGGGQQTAVFALLGARVTCVDISQEQLNQDRKAADHYGYDLTTIKSDMRDLGAFPDGCFDLVYQPVSACFIPDLVPLYGEVHRVLCMDGYYCVHHCNPATFPTSFDGGANGWDGQGFRIAEPYRGGAILKDTTGRENMSSGVPTGEYRHLLSDIFGQLIAAGFAIEDVVEDPRHFASAATSDPGTYQHYLSIVAAYFGIVCRKIR